jgi:integral membrane protein (TIGR01906 family)
LIAAATALVLLGGSILPFLNPVFVRFEQDRTGAGALTGYSPTQLDRVTGAMLADLVLWRASFDVTLDGAPVLKQPEIDHMLDVRSVFAGLYALVLAGAAVLVITFRRARDGDARAAAWRSVAGGARGLAIGMAVVGVFVLFAFDAAFEVFHRLFFSAGSYTFDPRTDKLVQLFPGAFWLETAMLVGLVAILAAIATWLIARARAGSGAV